MKHVALSAIAIAMALAIDLSPAGAQLPGHQPAAGTNAGSAGGAMPEYKQSMEGMHDRMMGAMDPDPTKAWVKMMIQHHQGALDMSRTVLKHAQDSEVRAMAQKTIDDQSKEINQLQDWLKRKGT